MINLLPKNNRKQLTASFYNVFILRALILFNVTILIMAGSFFIINMELENSRSSLKQSLSENKKKSSSFRNVKKSSDNISTELNKAKSIFKEQKHYSKLLFELARALPPEISISNFSISPDLIKKETSFNIETTEFNNVIKTKQYLEKSSVIKSVSINSTSKKEDSKKNREIIQASITIKFNEKEVDRITEWQN